MPSGLLLALALIGVAFAPAARRTYSSAVPPPSPGTSFCPRPDPTAFSTAASATIFSPSLTHWPLPTHRSGRTHFLWSTPIYSSIHTPRSATRSTTLTALAVTLAELRTNQSSGIAGTRKQGGAWHSSDLLSRVNVERLVAWDRHRHIALVPALLRLQDAILRAAYDLLPPPPGSGRGREEGRFIQKMWVTLAEGDEANAVHTHPHAVLSGVYHVHPGSPRAGGGGRKKLDARAAAGRVFFSDPRPTSVCLGTRSSFNSSSSTNTSTSTVPFMCRNFLASRGEEGAAGDAASKPTLRPASHTHVGDAGTSKWAKTHPGRLLLWPAWLPHRVEPAAGGRKSSRGGGVVVPVRAVQRMVGRTVKMMVAVGSNPESQ